MSTAQCDGKWLKLILQRAFVEGAAWFSWHAHVATLFPTERDQAEAEAVRRYGDPSLHDAPATSVLDWHYVDSIGWVASSCLQHKGLSCTWRVTVDATGKFVVSETDLQLPHFAEPFDSLADAQLWCELMEAACVSTNN